MTVSAEMVYNSETNNTVTNKKRAGGKGQAVHDAENCPIPPGLFKRDLVLPFLMFQEGGMKQKEIADEIRISPSTLSEMINRLVKDGYVER